MSDKYEFTLNSPLTDEDWDKITDPEFENSDRISFRTKSGKTVEFAKVVKGKWKRRLVDSGFSADWHCSECGWKTALEEHGYNFCPHCGADMREEPKRLEGE